mmetsp:Transcript_119494/g.345519  ORF Transcript_119494/g.345519 Transcript_119494/m.345519 type:complete len:248 (+) Transcript_119494:274-1017(+)
MQSNWRTLMTFNARTSALSCRAWADGSTAAPACAFGQQVANNAAACCKVSAEVLISSTFWFTMGRMNSAASSPLISLMRSRFLLSRWAGRLGCRRWQKSQLGPLAQLPEAKYKHGLEHNCGWPMLPKLITARSFSAVAPPAAGVPTSLADPWTCNGSCGPSLEASLAELLSPGFTAETFARSNTSATTWFVTAIATPALLAARPAATVCWTASGNCSNGCRSTSAMACASDTTSSGRSTMSGCASWM